MRRLLALFALSLAACMQPAGRSPEPHASTGALELIQEVEVHRLGGLAEPMLVESPNGAIFVSGYNGQLPVLWKSTDLGATWRSIDVGTSANGAVGNSDVSLSTAPDGTIYFAVMTYNPTAQEGVQIAVGVSRDLGASWHWETVSRARYDDRPWVAVAPNGTAHLIWNDGTGVLHATSRDRGITWTPPVHIHDRGGSSHMVIGPSGQIAVRIAPGARSGFVCDSTTELVALSSDDGATWRKVTAPGTGRTPGCFSDREIPRWVDPLAFDRTGTLYALWTDSSGVVLGRAGRDLSRWTTWRLERRTTSEPIAFYPYLAARGNGELAATWMLMTPDTLHWRAANIVVRGDGSAPDVRLSAPVALEAFRAGRASTGGEYLATAFLRDGSIGVVTPLQNPANRRGGFVWRRFR